MMHSARLGLSRSTKASYDEYDCVSLRYEFRKPLLPGLAGRDIRFVEAGLKSPVCERLNETVHEGEVFPRIGNEYARVGVIRDRSGRRAG
jgi:hypothetical protein